MFNKLKKIFRKEKHNSLIIHNCPLCKKDIKVKYLYKTKCCGNIYDKHCYKKFKRLFRMKPCCFN